MIVYSNNPDENMTSYCYIILNQTDAFLQRLRASSRAVRASPNIPKWPTPLI